MNKFAELYEHDFNAWIHNQISLLKAGKTNEIDVEHLIEELEDMGKSIRKSVYYFDCALAEMAVSTGYVRNTVARF